MSVRDVDPPEQRPFFKTFSRLHAGAIVTVRVDSRDEVVDQPFRGVSDDGADIVVSTGDGPTAAHHGHRVLRVRRVQLEQTDEGADASLTMTSEDGTRTEVRFRSPMSADLLDAAVE